MIAGCHTTTVKTPSIHAPTPNGDVVWIITEELPADAKARGTWMWMDRSESDDSHFYYVLWSCYRAPVPGPPTCYPAKKVQAQ